MKDDLSPWSVAGASALGARHVRTGAPNQDSYRSTTVTTRSGEVMILAVADGHGGSRYVRSDVGSRLAVEVASRLVADSVEDGLLERGTRLIERRVRDELIPSIVAAWASACLADLAAEPFTSEERDRAGSPLEIDTLFAYGSTLLVAALGASQSLLLQLGDGDCLVGTLDGRTVNPLPDDDRLTGGETTSLCLPEAVSDFRMAVVGDLDPVLVLLATDGYGVAFADAGWRTSVVDGLLDQLRAHGAPHVQAMLPGWLDESARVGGDDATAVVAYREGAPGGKPVRRTRRARLPLVVATLVGAMVGSAAAWGLAPARFTQSPDPGSLAAAVDTTVTTSIDDPRPTSPPTTSTSVPTPTTSTAPGPSGSGEPRGPVTGGSSRAWIVGPSGDVVEFSPSPEEPQPVLVAEPEDAPQDDLSETGSSVLVDRRWWSLVDGLLFVEETEVRFDPDPAMDLLGIEAENGRLWAISETSDRLLMVDPSTPMSCRLFEVVEEPDPGEPTETWPVGEDIQCTTRVDEGENR